LEATTIDGIVGTLFNSTVESTMNAEATRTAHTVCPLDCADTCSLKVDIAGEQVLRVRGSDKNPFTAGKLCAKVSTGFVEWVHGNKRLTTPLLRSGEKGSGQFEAVSWDRAYREIKQNYERIISAHGAQAILPLNYGVLWAC